MIQCQESTSSLDWKLVEKSNVVDAIKGPIKAISEFITENEYLIAPEIIGLLQ